VCLEFGDLAIFNGDGDRRRVTEALREARPELVVTASPVDYHCDHEAASALVRDACFAAPAPNYGTDTTAPLAHIPHLYFMDPVEGKDPEGNVVTPDFVVDIGGAFGRKREMLAEHASQREWLRQHHGTDNYLDEMERWTRARGALAGCEFGEGFRRYRGHAYPQSPWLEELLGAAVVRLR
jgi:LmbE family N-acetylglucosaminyl deacetylase